MANSTAQSSYAEKLKDPRWQRKRLEIMKRDNFTCQDCRSETKTLNVHHRLYIPGIEPWNYPDYLLITLCEECHKKEGEGWPRYVKELGERCQHCLLTYQVFLLSYAINHLAIDTADNPEFAQEETSLFLLITQWSSTRANRHKLAEFIGESDPEIQYLYGIIRGDNAND